MGSDQQFVRVTAADVSAALALGEPEPDSGSTEYLTTLDLMEKEPSGFGKVFKSGGVGLSVAIEPLQPGGPHHWFTDIRFPRGIQLDQAFARAGLEWPVWWAIDGVTHLIDKSTLKMLTFSGFAVAEYALPWFVRLHAVVADVDPLAPVLIRRTVRKQPKGAGDYRNIDSLWEFMREVNEDIRREATDEHLKQLAYEEWLEREAEWKRSGGRT